MQRERLMPRVKASQMLKDLLLLTQRESRMRKRMKKEMPRLMPMARL